MIRHGRWLSMTVASVIATSALLAGCATIGGASTPPAATATATTVPLRVPPIQTIALGNFMANYVIPAAHGVLLLGTPGKTGQDAGPTGYSALYYYDDASQQVTAVATPTPATDGTPRGVQYVAAAGDWAAYMVADSDSSHWELWALNLATDASHLVDSAAQEGILFNSDQPKLDGTTLAWYATSLTNGVTQNNVRVYTLATGATRTLLTLPGQEFAYPSAIFDGKLVYTRDDGNGNQTTWLWTLTDAAPKQIASGAGLTVTMNDRYVVWDDVHSRSLTLYDRATGTLAESWVGSCIRPALAEDRPYAVCVDFDTNTYRLARLPSGDDRSFSDHQSVNNDIGVSNDRAYWLGSGQGGMSSNQVDYFDLPPS